MRMVIAVVIALTAACAGRVEPSIGAGDSGADVGNDRTLPPVVADEYSRSCSRHSDCVVVGEGDPCDPCRDRCARAAIAVEAQDALHAFVEDASCDTFSECDVECERFAAVCRQTECETIPAARVDHAPHRISIDHYDRTCSTDDDCVLAQGGDVCATCYSACKDTSINKASFAAFSAERAAIDCEPGAHVDDYCICEQGSISPVCVGGRCDVMGVE